MKKSQIKIAVIPAAGKGNRIAELPLSRILPKPMLPLVNRPITEHIINWLKEIGVEKVYMIVSFKKEIFKEYFGDGKDFGVEIEYIECPDPENIGGLADGIYLLKDKIKEPFITVLGDDFTVTKSPNIFPDSFYNNKALVVEAVIKEDDIESLKRACTVNLGYNNKIIDIVEKPEKPKWFMRGCGIYIFDPIVFKYIEKTPQHPEKKRKDITKTIEIIAKKTKRAYGVPIDINININTLADLHRATLLLLSEQEEFLQKR
jgi:NDP-sugar pyrophosphorylase family protein